MTDNPSDGSKAQGQAMWGGRFSARPSDLMQAINVSIGFDKRLARQDLAGSRAHAEMLAAQGVISAGDEAGLIATGPIRDRFGWRAFKVLSLAGEGGGQPGKEGRDEAAMPDVPGGEAPRTAVPSLKKPAPVQRPSDEPAQELHFEDVLNAYERPPLALLSSSMTWL